MAAESVDLVKIIQEHQSGGEFQPYAYYGEEEDVLTVYFSGQPDYAKRLNSRVTVFLSLEGDELVGVQIKSVRYVLEDIGWFDVSIRHGKVRVDLLFLPFWSDFADQPERRELFRKIGEAASRTQLEFELPQAV